MIMTKTDPPLQQRGEVVENVAIARDTFRVRIQQPQIAARILPGQFVMIRVPGRSDPLLARPLALYDTVDDSGGEPSAIDLVYLVMGNGTRALSRLKPGDSVDLWGPLGNTFPMLERSDRLMIVAGGIGQTPFLSIIRELMQQRRYGDRRVVDRPESITFAWGVRSVDYLGGIEDFRQTGIEVQVATDDGSAGHQGYVTDLLVEAIDAQQPTVIFGCGPKPMLKTLAQITHQHSIRCWVSLETKMACGYGVCFSCVCPVNEAEGWDYRRVCIDGPVFPSTSIAWPELGH